MIPPPEAKPSPLSTVEARLLAALRRLDGARVYQLAEDLGRDTWAVEDVLQSLRRRGMVESYPGASGIVAWRVTP